MASIRKRNGRIYVRYRQPDGTQSEQRVPTQAAARKLIREIEEAVGLGRNWQKTKPASPTLEAVADAYLTHCKRSRAPGTVTQRAIALTLFQEWCEARASQRQAPLSVLSVATLESWHDHLVGVRGISTLTANDRVRMVRAFWRWAFERPDYQPFCTYPARIDLPFAQPALAPMAPTWEEMDAAIHQSRGWYRQLMLTLRFTGLRPGQAMRLRRDDIDGTGLLRIRGELGKTRQEKRGRIVPLSPHFLEHVDSWPTSDWLVDKHQRIRGPACINPDERSTHRKVTRRIWDRTGIDVRKYRQPLHCFRKGWISEMTRMGVAESVRKYLVGHSTGVHGDVYTVFWGLEAQLREAVGLIPRIGLQCTIIGSDGTMYRE